MGPCMCGDTACPSCGPAQGANPEFEMVCEWLQEVVLADMAHVIDCGWLAEDLANRLGNAPEPVMHAIAVAAAEWTRARERKHREERRLRYAAERMNR